MEDMKKERMLPVLWKVFLVANHVVNKLIAVNITVLNLVTLGLVKHLHVYNLVKQCDHAGIFVAHLVMMDHAQRFPALHRLKSCVTVGTEKPMSHALMEPSLV